MKNFCFMFLIWLSNRLSDLNDCILDAAEMLLPEEEEEGDII